METKESVFLDLLQVYTDCIQENNEQILASEIDRIVDTYQQRWENANIVQKMMSKKIQQNFVRSYERPERKQSVGNGNIWSCGTI